MVAGADLGCGQILAVGVGVMDLPVSELMARIELAER